MADGSYSTPPLPPWLRGEAGGAMGGGAARGGLPPRGDIGRRLAAPALFLAGLAAGWLLHSPKPPPLTPPAVAEAPQCPAPVPCTDPGPAHASAHTTPHTRAKTGPKALVALPSEGASEGSRRDALRAF